MIADYVQYDVILPIFNILYQIQHYISMFIVLLTKQIVQIIYFAIYINFSLFSLFWVKMITIFKYFLFGKYRCLNTNARGCCMHVFLVSYILTY